MQLIIHTQLQINCISLFKGKIQKHNKLEQHEHKPYNNTYMFRVRMTSVKTSKEALKSLCFQAIFNNAFL